MRHTFFVHHSCWARRCLRCWSVHAAAEAAAVPAVPALRPTPATRPSFVDEFRPLTNTSSSSQVLAANAVRVTVDSGVSNVPNMPFVSVTICAPGTTNCQTIDHMLVDTGSWGVRVFAVAIARLDDAAAADRTPPGNLVAECMQFFDGYTWGSVKLADVQIAGEKAASLPIQVIDPSYASLPSDCASVRRVAQYAGHVAGQRHSRHRRVQARLRRELRADRRWPARTTVATARLHVDSAGRKVSGRQSDSVFRHRQQRLDAEPADRVGRRAVGQRATGVRHRHAEQQCARQCAGDRRESVERHVYDGAERHDVFAQYSRQRLDRTVLPDQCDAGVRESE